MFINRFNLRTAGAALAAIVGLATPSLKAEAASDADRLAKLEAAGQSPAPPLPPCRADLTARIMPATVERI